MVLINDISWLIKTLGVVFDTKISIRFCADIFFMKFIDKIPDRNIRFWKISAFSSCFNSIISVLDVAVPLNLYFLYYIASTNHGTEAEHP